MQQCCQLVLNTLAYIMVANLTKRKEYATYTAVISTSVKQSSILCYAWKLHQNARSISLIAVVILTCGEHSSLLI
jgi:hypothetical protein